METIETQIKNLIEETLISHLLIKYFGAIDEKRLDLTITEATFTNDARIVRPNGSETTGIHNILAGHKESFARFNATQHVITDYIIDVGDDVATLRANLTAMHLWVDNDNNPSLNGKYFHAGVVLTAKATKVDSKWRICELIFRNIWRLGEGMIEMASFMKNLKTENS
jgi:hypothetical protein